MDPLLFGALTVVPGIASIVLPTVWGAAWAKHAPVVLMLSPLAQLVAQTLLVAGLSPMVHGWLAASALGLGLLFFSLGRAGIAVAQHAMLARTFTTHLAFAFSIVVGCTQLISGVCAWSVPRILASSTSSGGAVHDAGHPSADGGGGGGHSALQDVQIALLLPHVVSSAAGALLALQHVSVASTLPRGDPSNPSLPSYGRSYEPPWRYAIWLLAMWRALTVGSFHAFHPVIAALLVSVGLPLVAAGDLLASNSLLSLGALVLVGLLGRAARLKTLLLSAPLLALAALVALWLDIFGGWAFSVADATDSSSRQGLVLRIALLAMAFGGAAAPIVPLAMVPANVEPLEIGRGYGIVESLFEVAEVSLSVLLGFCRSRGGFSAALLLLSTSFGLAALVGLPLMWTAREQQTSKNVPEGLSATRWRRYDGLFTAQTCRDAIDGGREFLLALFGKKENVLASSEEGGAQNDYAMLKSGEKEDDARIACPEWLCARLVIAAVVTFGLAVPIFFGVMRAQQSTPSLNPTRVQAYTTGGGMQMVGSDGPRGSDGVSHSYWSAKPSDPPTYTAAVGATLVFRYSVSHNVWRMPSAEAFETCNFSAAFELASATHGGVAKADVARLGYANVYEAKLDTAGTMYFACQVGDHCAKGQKIAVSVYEHDDA